MKEQRVKAEWLRAMHHRPSPLVLPNAWDVITARIFEGVGFPAVGTTSAGMAAALGYADGSYLPVEMLEPALRRMVEAVQVPITADIEAGYGRTTQDTVDNVHRLIDTGIAGINIEDFAGKPYDALIPIEIQVERITAIRELAGAVGIPLVINARIDAVFHSGLEGSALMDEILWRACQYQQAGADCIFVFGVHDASTIKKLVLGISGPLNIMVGTGVPSAMELASLGVARISMGPAALLVAMRAVKQVAAELFTDGTSESSSQSAMSYQELNQYFVGQPHIHES